jgi:hypothetical protein
MLAAEEGRGHGTGQMGRGGRHHHLREAEVAITITAGREATTGINIVHALWRGPPTKQTMRATTSNPQRWCRMSDSKLSQLLDLECMGLASDCIQLGSSHLGEALQAEILEQAGVSQLFPDVNSRQKFDLECLRAAADCMQLAGEVRDPELQRYFIRRAGQLTVAAET